MGFNSIVEIELAEILVKPFLECIVAPDFDDQSLEIFKSKKNLRLIKTSKGFTLSNKMIKNALGGYLIQDRDQLFFDIKNCDIVTKLKPSSNEINALELGWKLVKYVKSNAIIFANNNQVLSAEQDKCRGLIL